MFVVIGYYCETYEWNIFKLKQNNLKDDVWKENKRG
jgi:hypothetical protein